MLCGEIQCIYARNRIGWQERQALKAWQQKGDQTFIIEVHSFSK